MRQVYLDYNATTPIAPSVFEVMKPFLTDHFGNPSSRHSYGFAVQHAIDDARQQVANLLGAGPEEIVFTSGGTESDNLAMIGSAAKSGGFAGHFVISAVEHPAIAEPAAYLESLGCEVTVVRTNRDGVVSPDDVGAAIRADTVLVSIIHANNEIGAIQPIAKIGQICRRHGVRFHTDAAQSIGKIRAKVDELGVDLLSLAGHKLYAPKGIGALYIRNGCLLKPLFYGGGQERGLRPSTENVAYIAGLGQAAKLADRSVDENQLRLVGLRDQLLDGLQSGVGSGLTVNGDLNHCLPNTLSVNFPGVVGQQLLDRAANVCASTGSACHAGATNRSATLAAIELPENVAQGTVRLSLGWTTSAEDVERSCSSLLAAWESLVAVS